MRKIGWWIGMAAALALTGCVESSTEVRVQRDGSGTVRVREFFSPQITSMLAMAAMQEAEGEAPGDFLEMMMAAKTEQMGPDAERVRGERLRNAAGWEGYEAEYRFPDVRRLRLRLSDSPSPEDRGRPEDDEAIRFEFSPGTPARLMVRQPPPAPGASEEISETEAEMAEAMMPMMASMMTGMRITFSVAVEDRILETNSQYVAEDRTSLVLMDLPMDRVLGNEEAMRMLLRQSPDAAERLAAMKIEGVRIEPPGKTVELTF